MTVPAVIASLAPQYVPIAPSATALIATSVVVTALLTPFLTAWWAGAFGMNSKRYQRRAAATAERTNQSMEPCDGNPASHPLARMPARWIPRDCAASSSSRRCSARMS